MKLIRYIWKKLKDFFSIEEELSLEEKIYEKQDKEIKHKREAKTDICNLETCKRKLNIANGFRCHYCNKYFCDKHRLPEEHICKAKLTVPKEMRAGTGFESFTFGRE